MILKLRKLYYATHKDRPSIFWEVEKYFWGKTENWDNLKGLLPKRAKFLDKRTFMVIDNSGTNMLLYFPELDITIWETVGDMFTSLEIFPFYSNINDLWSKVCLE